MAPITFEHVTKQFDEAKAVDDLSIQVADGEFLVLVGPSGCGKTTELRMLAGLEDITSGRILIGDRVVNNVAPGARDVAMVFQSYALYPHMTIYDNLAFGLRNRHLQKDEVARPAPANAFGATLTGELGMDLLPAEAIGVGANGQLAGFRPEHVQVGNGAAGAAHSQGHVEVVEYLGNGQLALLRLRDEPVVAKL